MKAVVFGGKRVCGLAAEALPVLDESLGAYMLRLLARHGAEAVTLCDCAEWTPGTLAAPPHDRCNNLELPDSLRQGLTLFIKEPMLTDCDLSALCAQHSTSGAERTLAVCRKRPQPGDTVVQLEKTGRIAHARFADADDITETMVAMSIYAMDGAIYASMGEDALQPIGAHSCILHGYWQPVRCPEGYAAAQQDLLQGRVGLPVAGVRYGRAIIAPGAQVDARARITGRCYIGHGAQIGPYALLGEGAVVGRGASIGRGVRVEHSCIWQYGSIPQWQVVRHLMIIPQAGNHFLTQILPYSSWKNA